MRLARELGGPATAYLDAPYGLAIQMLEAAAEMERIDRIVAIYDRIVASSLSMAERDARDYIRRLDPTPARRAGLTDLEAFGLKKGNA